MLARSFVIVRLVAFFHSCHYAYGLPLWWAQAAARLVVEGAQYDFNPECWWWVHEAACYSNYNWGMVTHEQRAKIHALCVTHFPTRQLKAD